MDLKNALKKRGWTISSIATQLGITQPAASRLINGNLGIHKLEEIANIIGVPLWELLRDDDTPTSHSLTCPHCGKEIKIAVAVDRAAEQC